MRNHLIRTSAILALALIPDRFNFATPAAREAGYLKLTRAEQTITKHPKS